LEPAHPERGGTKETPAQHIASTTLTKRFHDALKALHTSRAVPKTRLVQRERDGKRSYLTWYQATRHTFASHYMMAGGDLAKLQAELGHSHITTTQRYAKLSPELRTPKDRTLIQLPTVTDGKVVGEMGSKWVANEGGKKGNRTVSSRSNRCLADVAQW
jgi:hypothetical protein